MNIAELAVVLEFKGGDKVQKVLVNVKDGLGKVASEGLAAKAAIVGAVYALERLMAGAANRGTDLLNFSSLTGMSTKELQQWEYAAQQAGVSADEVMQNFRGLQKSIAETRIGRPPEGMLMISKILNVDPSKIDDIGKLLDLMVRAAKISDNVKGANKALFNGWMNSLGFSDNMIAAARRNLLEPNIRTRAPLYSEDQQAGLAKVGAMWRNLHQQWEMSFGKLEAAHGAQFIAGISKVSAAVLGLAQNLAKITEHLKFFELIKMAFDGWALAIGKVDEALSVLDENIGGDKKGKKSGGILDTAADLIGKGIAAATMPDLVTAKDILPSFRAGYIGAAAGANININNVFHGVKDGRESVDLQKRELNKAYRQSSTQGRVK